MGKEDFSSDLTYCWDHTAVSPTLFLFSRAFIKLEFIFIIFSFSCSVASTVLDWFLRLEDGKYEKDCLRRTKI